MNVAILDLARQLGANLKRVTAAEWAGPCPVCGGRDRFSVNTKRKLWNCRGCERGGDEIDLVRHVRGCGFVEAAEFVGREIAEPNSTAETIREIAEPEADLDPAKIAGALALWDAGIDPRGTVAEIYFRSRALDLDDLAGEVLRWHAGTGAMLALFRNISTGEPQAVSRRFLGPNGAKLGKPLFLGPVKSAAVMLDGFDAVTHGLHVGEGVETCQTARQFELRPTWALGSSGAIASLPVLGGVECLTLFAEHDDASAKAVEACATRWHAAGREVLINRPIGGKDLNDAIRGAA